jgi:hypothetical protein
MALPATATKNFKQLIELYRDLPVDFPHLKAASAAQWAMESGWGKSGLAAKHLNFAGMKWGQVDRTFGVPAIVGGETWTAFPDPAKFIQAYWHRLDNVSVFKGWRDHTKDATDFLVFVTPGWLTGRAPSVPLRPEERAYVRDILSIANGRMAPIFSQPRRPA